MPNFNETILLEREKRESDDQKQLDSPGLLRNFGVYLKFAAIKGPYKNIDHKMRNTGTMNQDLNNIRCGLW